MDSTTLVNQSPKGFNVNNHHDNYRGGTNVISSSTLKGLNKKKKNMGTYTQILYQIVFDEKYLL